MEQVIATLKDLPGVFGACVYNAEQKVIIDHMPLFLSADTQVGLGVQIMAILSLAREKLTQIRNVTLHFDEVSLIIHTVADKTILVLGESHMNERMVSYSLDMLGKTEFVAAGDKNRVSEAKRSATSAVDLSAYIPSLKQGLAKVVGPMADIIFDDALNKWQRAGDFTFSGLMRVLGDEVDDAQQFDRFVALYSKTIAEVQQREKLNG